MIKISKKICINTAPLNENQARILLLRGFTPEEDLLSQKAIKEALTVPSATVSYNIRGLKKKGLLTNLNYLTPDGKVVFQELKGYLNNTKKLRGHKTFGTLFLEEPYKGFDEVKDKYCKISSSPKHKGFRVEFKNCIILFYTPIKIVFYLPDVYGDSFPELYVKIYEDYLVSLKGYLEQEFPGLKISEYEIASVTINHLAYQNHPLAECFKKFKARYTSDRIEVDNSHGVPELETVHKKYSIQDMDKIIDYENSLRGSFNCNKKERSASQNGQKGNKQVTNR